MSQAPRSFENPARMNENRSQNDEKSRKNRRRALWGARGRSADVGGGVQERFGTRPGRPKSGLGTPQAAPGRPRRPQDAPKPPRGPSGEPPRPIRTTPGRGPRAFWTPKRVRTAAASNFRRYKHVAQMLRCGKIVAPANVLYTSDDVSIERLYGAKKWRRATIFGPKIGSGARLGALADRQNGLRGRSRALEAPPESLRIFFVGASEARSARKSAC